MSALLACIDISVSGDISYCIEFSNTLTSSEGANSRHWVRSEQRSMWWLSQASCGDAPLILVQHSL